MIELLGYGIYLLTLNILLTPQPNTILVSPPTPSAPPPPPPYTPPGKKRMKQVEHVKQVF